MAPRGQFGEIFQSIPGRGTAVMISEVTWACRGAIAAISSLKMFSDSTPAIGFPTKKLPPCLTDWYIPGTVLDKTNKTFFFSTLSVRPIDWALPKKARSAQVFKFVSCSPSVSSVQPTCCVGHIDIEATMDCTEGGVSTRVWASLFGGFLYYSNVPYILYEAYKLSISQHPQTLLARQ
jgi:hypothetical protein